jgi:hypothetical protein
MNDQELISTDVQDNHAQLLGPTQQPRPTTSECHSEEPSGFLAVLGVRLRVTKIHPRSTIKKMDTAMSSPPTFPL